MDISLAERPPAATSAGTDEIHAARIPGEGGIWVFIVGDLLIFSLFFVTFLYYRAEDAEIFASAQAVLNQDIGVLNTTLMLSSSLFVAMAVTAARRQMRAPPALFVMAMLCGAGFVVAKYFEYREKIAHGFVIDTNIFFTLYYAFTGIHLFHVVIGMGVLLFLALYSKNRAGSFGAQDICHLESGSCFWHVVDLLWIVLFALIYLVK